MRAAIFGMILFFMAGVASAYGPPDYTPATSHPRIWLTDTEMARLTAARDANTQQWSDLMVWCDAHINDTGYAARDISWKDYRGAGYETYLCNYSLAYQVLKGSDPTKAATYAAFVRNIVVDGIIKGFKVGEEDNGLAYVRSGEASDRTINSYEATALGIPSVGSKLGYTTRSLAAVALAYDWIYDTLSDADRALVRNSLLRWIDWTRGKRSAYNNGMLVSGVRYYEDRDGDCTGANVCTDISNVSLTQGFEYGVSAGNFMSGHFYLASLAITAIYGEFPESADYWQYLNSTLFTGMVKAEFNSNVGRKGGDSVEGWNYGSGLWRYLKGMHGMNTATGMNVFSGFDFPQDCLKANLHRIGPNLKDVPIYGTWTGTPMGENRRYITLPFVGINRRVNGDTTEVKVGQYLLDNVAMGDTRILWDELLWYEQGKATLSPSSLPLSYLAIGDGFVTSRDSWNSDATFLSARLAGRWLIDKESYDQGTITVERGSDRLLTHQNEIADSQSNNTVVFNETNHFPNNYALTSPCIDREGDGGGYYYVSGDITNAWKKQWGTDKAKLFRRSILHLRNGRVVVFDHTRSNTAVGLVKSWYTNYIASPTVAGDTITAAVGSSKVFVKTIFPTGGTYTTTNPATGYWRVKYAPAAQQEYEQFLHVIETAGSAGTQTATTAITGTGTKGALISDPTENKVVMFSADQDGADMTTLSYSVDTSAASRHYIANLVPNAVYAVTIDGGAATNYTASAAGVVEFVNTIHSPHTYTVVKSGTAPATRTTRASGRYTIS